MLYLSQQNEINAIQITKENYNEIVCRYDGYQIINESLYGADGTRKNDDQWICEFNTPDGIVIKIMTDALFNLIFKKKPEEKFALADLALQGKRARLEDFPEGDYVEWNGFAWSITMSGIRTLYSPTPEELTNKVWLVAK